MLKSLFCKTFRLIILTLLIAQITLSTAIAQETQPSESNKTPTTPTVNPRTSETEKEEIKVDRNKETADATKDKGRASKIAYPQPPNPYDMEAIEKFDEELYGKGR
jgi:hypothetical protein